MPPKITDPVELAAMKKKFANDPLTLHLTPGNLAYLRLGRALWHLEIEQMLAEMSRRAVQSEEDP